MGESEKEDDEDEEEGSSSRACQLSQKSSPPSSEPERGMLTALCSFPLVWSPRALGEPSLKQEAGILQKSPVSLRSQAKTPKTSYKKTLHIHRNMFYVSCCFQLCLWALSLFYVFVPEYNLFSI